MRRFSVEFTLIGKASAFVFESYCPICEKPVYTCIGTEVFDEWAQRESLALSDHDATELRKMNIAWDDQSAA
jgi:hypothetical protein